MEALDRNDPRRQALAAPAAFEQPCAALARVVEEDAGVLPPASR